MKIVDRLRYYSEAALELTLLTVSVHTARLPYLKRFRKLRHQDSLG